MNGNGNGSGRLSGIVVRIVEGKGFGFIRDKDGREFFFHSSETPAFHSIEQGSAVTFVMGKSPKGPRAALVEPVV